jgi:hypothetical protein
VAIVNACVLKPLLWDFGIAQLMKLMQKKCRIKLQTMKSAKDLDGEKEANSEQHGLYERFDVSEHTFRARPGGTLICSPRWFGCAMRLLSW